MTGRTPTITRSAVSRQVASPDRRRRHPASGADGRGAGQLPVRIALTEFAMPESLTPPVAYEAPPSTACRRTAARVDRHRCRFPRRSPPHGPPHDPFRRAARLPRRPADQGRHDSGVRPRDAGPTRVGVGMTAWAGAPPGRRSGPDRETGPLLRRRGCHHRQGDRSRRPDGAS